MSNISSVSELESLTGLDAAKRTVRGIFERQSPVHAVLFYGEEGSGKTTLARLLAGYWLCSKPTSEGPCLECRACKAWAKDTSSDLMVVRPRGGSNLITLPMIYPKPEVEVEGEPVLSIQEFLRTMPVQARSKVILMESAERMTGDAARALLKTLEEPPEHACFVLTTTEVSRVESTIRSRCMSVPCELPEQMTSSDDWEMALARRSPGLRARVRANPEVYEGIYALAQALSNASRQASLSFSERFRKLVERLQKAEETNARFAGATALRTLGVALRSLGAQPEHVQRIAVSHRRILGNVNSGLEFDALFSEILRENG